MDQPGMSEMLLFPSEVIRDSFIHISFSTVRYLSRTYLTSISVLFDDDETVWLLPFCAVPWMLITSYL